MDKVNVREDTHGNDRIWVTFEAGKICLTKEDAFDLYKTLRDYFEKGK